MKVADLDAKVVWGGEKLRVTYFHLMPATNYSYQLRAYNGEGGGSDFTTGYFVTLNISECREFNLGLGQ